MWEINYGEEKDNNCLTFFVSSAFFKKHSYSIKFHINLWCLPKNCRRLERDQEQALFCSWIKMSCYLGFSACLCCALAKAPKTIFQSNLELPSDGGCGKLDISFCCFGVFNLVSLCNQK